MLPILGPTLIAKSVSQFGEVYLVQSISSNRKIQIKIAHFDNQLIKIINSDHPVLFFHFSRKLTVTANSY
jgi:hypothetical protein